jgi:hypothetical protein
MPDDVVFVDDSAHRHRQDDEAKLREQFKDYKLPLHDRPPPVGRLPLLELRAVVEFGPGRMLGEAHVKGRTGKERRRHKGQNSEDHDIPSVRAGPRRHGGHYRPLRAK